ncbi:MAG: T9SS type A sorting domain-containing protein [Bacteroidota bacterium]
MSGNKKAGAHENEPLWKSRSAFRCSPLRFCIGNSGPGSCSGGHSFCHERTQWKAQEGSESARIHQWLNSGVDPGVVSVEKALGLASRFELSQNYPNPFNPTTRITYSLPTSGQIVLKVFNILGQHVATLFEGFRNAGTYVSEFDASRFPSGMYFYRLSAGELVETGKMVLLR